MVTRIDHFVTDVLRIYGNSAVPVDPLRISENESLRVELLPNADRRFGRIEFVKEACNFIAYCSDAIKYDDPVARFSLCHELGHFFIEEHRQLLINGKSHNSKSGFICNTLLEREADEFAAKLLIPPMFFKEHIGQNQRLSLDGLIDLANLCKSSLTSACIRYIKSDIEPCALVMISKNEGILRYSPSESARKGGFANLGHKTIPETSVVRKAIQAGTTKGSVHKAQSSTREWFSSKRREAQLWEEAFVLGNTGLTLVMLYLDLKKYEKGDYFYPSERYKR